MELSEKLQSFISTVIETPELWKVNYYLRSMKKAPHGGVFNNIYPNMFLKYYTCQSYLFLAPRAPIPRPVLDAADTFRAMFDKADIDLEEILQFCFRAEPGEPGGGNRVF